MARDKSRVKQAHKKTGRQNKEAIVAVLSYKAQKAKGMVFTDYRGLTHKQIETLKKEVKTMDAEYVITKNTLLKLALSKNTKLDGGEFEQQTATLFLYNDPVAPLKALAKLVKELQLPTIKFGFIDGTTVSAEDVIKLSALPGRQVLLTQIAVGLKSPIFGLHRAMNWNLQKLVMTLNAVSQKKQA